jgi:hypothetical protein
MGGEADRIMTSADGPILVRCLNEAELREYAALLEPLYPGRIVQHVETQLRGPEFFLSVRPAA